MRITAVNQKFFRLPLLLLAGLLVWLYATGLWRLSAWQVPASYSVDALEMLARLKLSGASGLGYLLNKANPQLGAPWGADWAAYPMPDAPVFIIFGKLSSVIGLIAASNLALLFAHLSAVATFYVCSRALGHRALFAAGGALLFGFSFYLSHRGLSHFSFALAYVVPAQLLSAWLIGSGRVILDRPRWRIFCLATAFATGIGNPYFGFGYGQLMALALAFQSVTARHRRNLTLGLTCLAVFGATLILLNYSALAAMLGSQAGLLQRNYASTEIYGFRPIELLIPPSFHRWAVAAEIGRRYAAASSLKGELFFPYFGLAGFCGVLIVVAATGQKLLQGRTGLRPAYAPTFLWIIGVFMVGGLNGLLAFNGVDLFRAGNRYSIYLLAIALFALTAWASRRGRRLKPWAAAALVVPAVFAGLWDQLPKARSPKAGAALSQKIAQDERLARCLETELPPGAAVFQLPVMPFLEQPPVNGMGDYELFRPYLFSDRTRFSYGLLANDKALLWQRWIIKQPTDQLCAGLEKAGFAALYLHKAAFPDSGAALRQELTALGKKTLFDEGDHVVFLLHPDTPPQLPDLTDLRLTEPWNQLLKPEDNQPQLFATAEWFPLEHDDHDFWRWSGKTGAVNLWCPGNQPMIGTLDFFVATLQPGRLFATIDGHEVWSTSISQWARTDECLTLTLQPGANHVDFHFDGRPARPSAADRRLLGFRLINLRVKFAPRP